MTTNESILMSDFRALAENAMTQLRGAQRDLPLDATPAEVSRHTAALVAAKNHVAELSTLMNLATGGQFKCPDEARRMHRVATLAIHECRRELELNGIKLKPGASEIELSRFFEAQDEANEALVAAETHALFAVMHLGRAVGQMKNAIGA